jgi:hypothetical protein
MGGVARPPASTKTSLGQRLSQHARSRWPALTRVEVRCRGQFAYVDGQLAGSPEEALDCACGLYLGDPTAWQPDPSPTT